MKAFPLSLFFFLLILLPVSCDKENENPVPFVSINFSINIESTQFLELNTFPSYAYFSGGFRGIIIYRDSYDSFYAFDRACPYHPYEQDALVRVLNTPLAIDTLCGSNFLLLDGSVITGPSRHPLRQYRTFFSYPILQVTSY